MNNYKFIKLKVYKVKSSGKMKGLEVEEFRSLAVKSL